jgi:peptidoglycan/LPS O-acetylase OafA/YrhL
VVVVAGRWRKSLVVVAAIGITGALAARFALWDGGSGLERVYYGSDTRADGLLVGCLLAVMVARGWVPKVSMRWATVAGAAITVGVMVFPSMFTTAVVVPTVVPWVSAALILATMRNPGWLGRPVLIWLGKRSYGIYLWHYPLMMAAFFRSQSMVAMVLAGVLSVGVAALSWRFVEEPLLRRRRGKRELGEHQHDLLVSGERRSN